MMHRPINEKNYQCETETIAAVSTPVGEGGIGIIRISGPQAMPMARRLFQRANGQSAIQPYRQCYGHIVDPYSGDCVDEVLLTVMPAPHSYTREDVVEISGHGGAIPLRMVLDLVCAQGARLALPGEFTQRAFLNGRIDLTQAEAVLDTIRAKTDAGVRAAQRHLQGEIGVKVRALRQRMITLLASLEAAIDFADDDLTFLTHDEIDTELAALLDEVQALIASHRQGRLLREGALTAIIGRPNTGKSSLLNALVGESRAIVTEVPGTTRDIIEETIAVAGIPLRVLDTAGIRHTEDVVERIGVERSRNALQQADLILLVLDRSVPLTDEDRELLELVPHRPAILVMNKADLPPSVQSAEIGDRWQCPVVEISATTGQGMETLRDEIRSRLLSGEAILSETPMLANQRQRHAAERAAESLQNARDTLAAGGTEELLAVDLMAAAGALGEITGEDIREEIAQDLFARFCVGK